MSARRTAGAAVSLSHFDGLDVRPLAFAVDHFVTADGRVYSTARGGGRIRERRPTPNHGGYLQVFIASVGRSVPVHQCVATAFLSPRPSPQHQVRHLDGDRRNNHASNLAWGTPRENIADRERHGTTARGARNGAHTKPARVRRGEDNGRSVLTAEQVAEIRARYARGERRADLAREFGVGWCAVDRAARGESWVAGGAEEDARKMAPENNEYA